MKSDIAPGSAASTAASSTRALQARAVVVIDLSTSPLAAYAGLSGRANRASMQHSVRRAPAYPVDRALAPATLLVVLLLASGCVVDDSPAPTGATIPPRERARLRASVSDAMAERQETRRYGDAWSVLAEGAGTVQRPCVPDDRKAPYASYTLQQASSASRC